MQFAADLAAFFSKARDDLKADVIVARAAAVKKPKGAKPGQVHAVVGWLCFALGGRRGAWRGRQRCSR